MLDRFGLCGVPHWKMETLLLIFLCQIGGELDKRELQEGAIIFYGEGEGNLFNNL